MVSKVALQKKIALIYFIFIKINVTLKISRHLIFKTMRPVDYS